MSKVVRVWSTAGISPLPLLSFFLVVAVNQIRAGGEWGGNLLLLWFASNTNNSSSPQIWKRLRGIKNKRSWVQTPFGLVKKPTCWINNHRTQNLVSVPSDSPPGVYSPDPTQLHPAVCFALHHCGYQQLVCESLMETKAPLDVFKL